MSLFLLESSLVGVVATHEELDQKVTVLQEKLTEKEATLIELQVSKDFARAFFIIEADEEKTASTSLQEEGISVQLAKNVRLVGDELENVKGQKDVVNYLVEWNLPEDL